MITAGGFTGETRKRRLPAAMPTPSRSAASSSLIRTCRAACSTDFRWTPYNRATFYGGEEIGYTDYPVHDELQRALKTRRHCERSEAIHEATKKEWIASSLSLLAMTMGTEKRK